jgi:hypothetical protein
MSVAAVAFGVMLCASAAWSQSRPNAPGPGGAYQPPPPAPQPMQPGQPPPQQQQQQQQMQPLPPAEFQPTSYYPESYGTDYPRAEVNAVAPALVRVVVARAQLRRAESGLNLAILEMRKAFERSRDYVAAINDERDAWDAYVAARAKAMRSLQNDASYVASVNLKQTLASQLDDLRRDSKKLTDQMLAMAQVKMGYASTASQMEAAAVGADPDVQNARQRLRTASARVSDLRAQFDQNVRISPQVLDARHNLDDARIAHLATDAYFWATLDTANVALDYSYYLHRYDYYKYASYGYYGYNYAPYGGGGGGYRVGYPIGYPYMR